MATKLLAEEQVREALGIAKGMLHKPLYRARLGLSFVSAIASFSKKVTWQR